MLFSVIAAVSATCNVIVITDPSCQDPNGAAAGSMSFANNMFQSSFIMSKNDQYAMLSGGEGNGTERNYAIIDALAAMQHGASPSAAAALATGYEGIRLVIGGPTMGAAIGGDYNAYLVVVDDSEKITVTHHQGGVVQLPQGSKGAIIHLRNSEGNPMSGTAESVRRQTAINIGKMIRDGYPATYIVGKAMKEVAEDSGEKYGGGAVNLVSCISTGDMFVPDQMNTTGYPMDENYSKSCPKCGWATGYPDAERYNVCPYCGGELNINSATDILIDAITVSKDAVSVSVYGSDRLGLSDITREVVKASVKKYGYNASSIAGSLNKGINNGLIVGVDYVEPSDLNVKADVRAVGVYYNALPAGRSSPAWDLPINSMVLTILGTIQTAIGFVLIVLVLFRTRLLKNFRDRIR
ncbi:MAG: hypothetical protein IJP12_02450 [Methanobrevibacter sp.]|nr:hypothetical protein [Methanobrevibacter sp.]